MSTKKSYECAVVDGCQPNYVINDYLKESDNLRHIGTLRVSW